MLATQGTATVQRRFRLTIPATLNEAIERGPRLYPHHALRRRVVSSGENPDHFSGWLRWMMAGAKQDALLTATLLDMERPASFLCDHCETMPARSLGLAVAAAKRNGHRSFIHDGMLYALSDCGEVVSTGLPAEFLKGYESRDPVPTH
ncbi:MAG: hypothetical protein Fues2KO_51990 [Fuerstiella sp.]